MKREKTDHCRSLSESSVYASFSKKCSAQRSGRDRSLTDQNFFTKKNKCHKLPDHFNFEIFGLLFQSEFSVGQCSYITLHYTHLYPHGSVVYLINCASVDAISGGRNQNKTIE